MTHAKTNSSAVSPGRQLSAISPLPDQNLRTQSFLIPRNPPPIPLLQHVHKMAPTAVIEREAPDVVPQAHAPMRSRLPTALRVPILISLNMGINALLWEFTSNFLSPELGAVSKVPNEDDVTSLYSPAARIAMRWLTVCMTWYFNYDCESRAPEELSTRIMANSAQSTMSRPSSSSRTRPLRTCSPPFTKSPP